MTGIRPASMRPPPVFVAPASEPVTELHIEADIGSVTVCGVAMREYQLWQAVDRLDGDAVCAACLRGTPVNVPVQGSLL